MNQSTYVQGTLFEKGYLIRTLGTLAHSPDVALTELVANAWDAGASRVEITIPSENGGCLIVKDDGTGMTPDEFHARWMRLAYNRLEHQGTKVVFPVGRSGQRRAYGRHGKGRHGLLCFADSYSVETCRDGKQGVFRISTIDDEHNPFVIADERITEGTGTGTTLHVNVERNLLKPDRILRVLAARFLHDPQFEVWINGHHVPLHEHEGKVDESVVPVTDLISVTVTFIDTTRAARHTHQQGIAYWVGGRLVGEPSWIWGRVSAIDGRTRLAKQYTAVVQADNLGDQDLVEDDWTGFRKSEVMELVYEKVAEHVRALFAKVAKEHVKETRDEVRDKTRGEVADLSPLGRYEVNEYIDALVEQNPTMRTELMADAVKAAVVIEKKRSGAELLQKLMTFTDEDIEGLNRLLDQWTVRDALIVLDEVDKRLRTIEAIRKLSGDGETDELNTLQPLVSRSRWLFGPEFESSEFSSNLSIRNAIEKVFKVKVEPTAFPNYRKRPDLFILGESTFSITATEAHNAKSNLFETSHVLILELKKGASTISRVEMDQACGYVEDTVNCDHLPSRPYVDAFVVGHAVKKTTTTTRKVGDAPEVGRVQAICYSDLVATAERRLFRLRDQLRDRYAEEDGMTLYAQTVQQELEIKVNASA